MLKYKTEKMKHLEDKGNKEWIVSEQIGFGGNLTPTWTASIDHNLKVIRPCHGYFKPHKEGKRNEKIAKQLGYEFKNI